MSFQTISLKKEGGIATIVLNRPEKMNAMNRQMMEELAEVVSDIEQDDDVRVVILTGAGRAFCAGADLTEPALSPGTSPEESRLFIKRTLGRMVLGLHKMEKPTIAMVNGVASGGGFELTLACDIRIGSEKARFLGYSRVAYPPHVGGTWFLPRILGIHKACEVAFSSKFVEAEEAEKIGLLNKLVSAEDLETETMSLAQDIAGSSPVAIRLTKMLMYKGLEVDLETQLEQEVGHIMLARESEDHREAVSAFLEKRKPDFRGE